MGKQKRYKDVVVKKTCKYCGEVYNARTYEGDESKTGLCSKYCSKEYYNESDEEEDEDGRSDEVQW